MKTPTASLLTPGPIGIFDSGYGGLTVLKDIAQQLPNNDFIYLGDNARAPYGNRSFDTVYAYTLQCVNALFNMGCNLVILACNTASAKALRNIQQKDLPGIHLHKRVLGVIRPTAEIIGTITQTKHLGIVATEGTVASESYLLEIAKFWPDVKVCQEACPIWVSLVENDLITSPGAAYFVSHHLKSLLSQDEEIDTILLGCTHYPLLVDIIKASLPAHIHIVSQGDIVAKSLRDYLHRHPQMHSACSQHGSILFYTTDDAQRFSQKAALFFGRNVKAQHIKLA
jgi:glutamate racemase